MLLYYNHIVENHQQTTSHPTAVIRYRVLDNDNNNNNKLTISAINSSTHDDRVCTHTQTHKQTITHAQKAFTGANARPRAQGGAIPSRLPSPLTSRATSWPSERRPSHSIATTISSQRPNPRRLNSGVSRGRGDGHQHDTTRHASNNTHSNFGTVCVEGRGEGKPAHQQSAYK